jgi:hypothetical protein
MLFSIFAVLLFAAGGALGGYFASVTKGRDAASGIRLYYADLLGAALGGFVVSAVLIPLAGLRASLLCCSAALAASAFIAGPLLPQKRQP